jgi:hypothetical protein
MTAADIEILVRYLQKAVVPTAEQEAFMRAFQRLLALQNKAFIAA